MTMRRPPIRLNAMTVSLMTRAMLDGPNTSYDLADICGLGIAAIGRYLRALRKAKAVYIAHWDQDAIGRFVIPAYQLGTDRPDAKRPPRERLRRRRARAAREAHKAMIHMTAGRITEGEQA